MAMVHNGQERFADAVESALKTTDLDFRLAEAHLHLGIALARQGEAVQSLRALETCLKLDPQIRQAHEWVALLLEGPLGDPEAARRHRQVAIQLLAKAEVERGRQ